MRCMCAHAYSYGLEFGVKREDFFCDVGFVYVQYLQKLWKHHIKRGERILYLYSHKTTQPTREKKKKKANPKEKSERQDLSKITIIINTILLTMNT